MSRIAKLTEWNNDGKQFIDYWRKHFSIILQQSNAKVILKKLDRLSVRDNDEACTEEDAVCPEDRTVQFILH